MNNKKEITDSKTLNQEKKSTIIRIIIIAAVFAIIAAGCIWAYPYAKILKTPEGRIALSEYLQGFGLWGALIFTAIQTAQVIIAVIPPVQIVGGFMYGTFLGTVFSALGTFLGSMIIFKLSRALGQPLAQTVVSKKNLDKFGFIQNEEKLEKILFILYLIPGVPKDVITYIVALSPIKEKNFYLFVLPARIPAIIMSAVFGSCLASESYVGLYVVIALFILIGIFGFLYREKIINGIKTHRKS